MRKADAARASQRLRCLRSRCRGWKFVASLYTRCQWESGRSQPEPQPARRQRKCIEMLRRPQVVGALPVVVALTCLQLGGSLKGCLSPPARSRYESAVPWPTAMPYRLRVEQQPWRILGPSSVDGFGKIVLTPSPVIPDPQLPSNGPAHADQRQLKSPHLNIAV